ncbi:MAG: ATP-grasp domain-containing protein [Christensenella sp.]|uniref:ATP-grasp domain-containing protein n=1 Tax=Christensenella sp. TaxID=1935934 RepID=UPI002B20A6A1|nr:ATP-grasp domain-containing protein [Christensenella sp.]MEA5003001.1 ATP-grasp domain-containing protein [Christensenella sp.]
MKRIAIIGASEFQEPLIVKAKEMGYETHVFAWKCDDPGEKSADFFYPVSIVEKEEILKICAKLKPEGIVTVASDLATVTVNYVALKLGLAANSEACTLRTTNKFEMRRALKRAGLVTPRFCLLDEQDKRLKKGMQYPVIVKPTDRSGSRGIMKVEHAQELAGAADCAIEYSFEKKAIAEEFIEGEEYSCESISFEGKHTCLALTKKYTTGAPHYIETGHVQPAGFTRHESEAIKTEIVRTLDALDISTGASHADFRIPADGEVRIIEVGARMGGDCIGSHLVSLSTGYDFLRMVIDAACGKKPDLSVGERQEAAAVRFVFYERDLEQLEQIRRIAPGIIVEQSPMRRVDPERVVDSSTRAGYYILAGDEEKIADFFGMTI